MQALCTPSKALKRLRALMGWTQLEASHFLGVSKKAVESYEQGWRDVPDHIWKSLLTLAAVEHHYPHGYRRCWEIMHCAPAQRRTCFGARSMGGRFCWMTSATNCHQNHPERQNVRTCLCCPVVRQFTQPAGAPRRRAA